MSLFLRSCVAFLFSFLFVMENSGAQEKLSLQQALDLAMNNNPQVLVAQKEVDAANARILQAEAIPNLEFGLNWDETPSNFDITKAGERNIGLVQPFEFPGKRGARSRVAKIDVQFFEENLRRTNLLVSAEVKRVYYQAWLNQKLVANFEAIADLLQQFRETATARYQAQKVTFLEVLRAKTELAKINNEIIAARREAQNALAELNRLLGRPGSTPLALADDFTYQPFTKTVEMVVNEMRQISVSRRLSETLVERGRAQMRLAQKSYLPDFSVGLFNQKRDGQPPFTSDSPLGVTESGLWGIDVGVSIPLWFWKGPRGQAEEARAFIDLAQIQREAVDRNITTAIENAHRSVKAAEEQVRLFEETLLRDVEDELRTGISHYQTDQIDALNLIDIYRTYTATQAEYYRALYNYHVALADLEVAGETALEP
ncbi:TolC family protein [candidate division KSB1 bacterium]|nr:TolC family protein [candidate division KSB1 bacterium]